MDAWDIKRPIMTLSTQEITGYTIDDDDYLFMFEQDSNDNYYDMELQKLNDETSRLSLLVNTIHAQTNEEILRLQKVIDDCGNADATLFQRIYTLVSRNSSRSHVSTLSSCDGGDTETLTKMGKRSNKDLEPNQIKKQKQAQYRMWRSWFKNRTNTRNKTKGIKSITDLGSISENVTNRAVSDPTLFVVSASDDSCKDGTRVKSDKDVEIKARTVFDDARLMLSSPSLGYNFGGNNISCESIISNSPFPFNFIGTSKYIALSPLYQPSTIENLETPLLFRPVGKKKLKHKSSTGDTSPRSATVQGRSVSNCVTFLKESIHKGIDDIQQTFGLKA